MNLAGGGAGDGGAPAAPHDTLKIVSWNVNGLRALPSRDPWKSVAQAVRHFDADVVCFQETKLGLASGALTEDIAAVDGFHSYFSTCRVRDGYSGVVTYVRDTLRVLAAEEGVAGACRPVFDARVRWRDRPDAVGGYASPDVVSHSGAWRASGGSAGAGSASLGAQGAGADDGNDDDEMSQVSGTASGAAGALDVLDDVRVAERLDNEGRVLIVDLGGLVVINVYVPCLSSEESGRYHFKRAFCQLLLARVHALQLAGRRVVLLGDMNAVSSRLDHCDPSAAERDWQSYIGAAASWSTHPFVAWIRALIDGEPGGAGATPARRRAMVDTFRALHPARGHAYTCWNQKTFARQTNYGTRIDYILVDEALLLRNDDSDASASSGAAPSTCSGLRLLSCELLHKLMGSDHCPVVSTFAIVGDVVSRIRADEKVELPALCETRRLRAAGRQSSMRAFLSSAQRAGNAGAQPRALPTPVAAATSSTARSDAAATAPAAPLASPACVTASAPSSQSKPTDSATTSSSAPSVRQAGGAPAPPRAAQPANRSPLPSGKRHQGAVGNTLMSWLSKTSSSESAASARSSSAAASVPAALPTTGNRIEPPSASLPAAGAVERTPSTDSSASASSASAWRSLLGGLGPAPLCAGHREPCALRTSRTDKNQNRKFWICPRGKGAADDPQSQCNFFQWADEWKTRRAKGDAAGAADASSTARERPAPLAQRDAL